MHGSGRPGGHGTEPGDTPGGSAGAILVHLLGAHRGTTRPLTADHLRIGTSVDSDLHFPADREPAVGESHAILERRGDSYLIRPIGEHVVKVDGQPVESRVLEGEEILEIGAGGPLLRFRWRDPRSKGKTLRQALADCAECARHQDDRWPSRLWLFLRGMPGELFTQTSQAARVIVAFLLLALFVGTSALAIQAWRLERRLDSEAARLGDRSAILQVWEGLSREELRSIRDELEDRLSETVQRIEALEAQSEAAQRVIAAASRSVVFLQGAYGFLDSASGRPLRIALGPDGTPLIDSGGRPVVGPTVAGPIFQRLFTGTGFIVSEDGLLLTNRHIALPWQFDEASRGLIDSGLAPVMRRLIGYLPGEEAPFEVSLVAISESADLAVLRCSGITEKVEPLSLAESPPRPGDEVVVLGYPTGIRAVLARSDPEFVESLMQQPDVDFWSIARRLSAEGRISPLATRGIVGQVTESSIVYDAETTSGGSGGPVIAADQRVVAINARILTEFGGSNLGVPAAEARRLLSRVPRDEANPVEDEGPSCDR